MNFKNTRNPSINDENNAILFVLRSILSSHNLVIKKKNQLSIFLLLSFFALLIVFIFFTRNSHTFLSSENQSYLEEDIPSPNPNDHYKWKSSSPITVVNYFSLDCPHCRELYNREDSLRHVYENTFSLIYRHSPLPQIQPLSFKKSVIAECVYENSGEIAFFNFVRDVFRDYDTEQVNNEWVESIAMKHISDAETFDVCLREVGVKKINRSIEEALAHKVYGTPTIAVFQDNVLILKLELVNATIAIRLFDSLRNTKE